MNFGVIHTIWRSLQIWSNYYLLVSDFLQVMCYSGYFVVGGPL